MRLNVRFPSFVFDIAISKVGQQTRKTKLLANFTNIFPPRTLTEK